MTPCRWPCPKQGRRRGLCYGHYKQAQRDGELWMFPSDAELPRIWPLWPLTAKAKCTRSQLSFWAGVSGEAVKRAAEEGLTDLEADRWAVACGLHPSQVWPRWDEHGLGPLDEAHLAGGNRALWLWAEDQADEGERAA